METTCGIVYTDGQSILMVHPTEHEDKWSVPKGICDPGEGQIVAAFREFEEEVGIELAFVPSRMELLCADIPYNKGKHITLVRYKVAKLESIENMRCDSMYENKHGQALPEVDAYKYITYGEIQSTCFPNMVRVLEDIPNLLG